ncbi:hypothetical protein ACO0R3_003367 [Hanseniaspora guilliermondii]
MSESSLSVIDYEDNNQQYNFLKSYIVDSNEQNAISKDDHKITAMNYVTTLSSPLTDAWKLFLANPQFQNNFNRYIKSVDVISSYGLSYFLTSIIRDVGYNKLNQYTKICLLVIQIGLLDLNSFDHLNSEEVLFVNSLSNILDSSDLSFLYDCYLNLTPLVLKPFLEAFPFQKFLTVSNDIDLKINNFSLLDLELRSYNENQELLKDLILSDLKNLTMNDAKLSNVEILNVLNKSVNIKGNVVDVYFGHQDTVEADLDNFSEKLSAEVLESIRQNKLVNHIRSVNANLLKLPSNFANVSQEERLSMKYLSHLSKTLGNESDDKSNRFFCHRNVLTNIIISINKRDTKGVNFRAFRTSSGIFLQPIEEPRRSDDYKTNPAVRAGFGFENFLSAEGELKNSYTYLMNKFKLGNKEFYVQSEIDSCSSDLKSFYELKTISQNGFLDANQMAEKCLRAWAQNFFIPNQPTTILGLRSKNHILSRVYEYTQSELLNEWNLYFAEDRSHLRSHSDVIEFNLSALSSIFDYIKTGMTSRALEKDTKTFMKHFNVKYRASDQSIHTSCFFSHLYDLAVKDDVNRATLFVRQALEALYNEHDYY